MSEHKEGGMLPCDTTKTSLKQCGKWPPLMKVTEEKATQVLNGEIAKSQF